MTSVSRCTVLEPGAGLRIDLGLGCPTVKVGPLLSGQVGMVDGELPSGGGFPVPHWHEDLDEVFYVLEGEVEFLLEGQWRRVGAGSTVFVPAGCVHAFRNASSRPARQLVVGQVEVVELISELGDHPRERWEEVHERHRSHYAKEQPETEQAGQPVGSALS